MIGFVKGFVEDFDENSVLIDAGSIGYNVFVPSSVIKNISGIGGEIKLYTYTNVRQDAILLFGFLTKEELSVFKLLINVNGIGPKAGLSILSTLSPNDLRYAVISDDVKTITGVPGIGSKTAQKLILELKDKLNLEDVFTSEAETKIKTTSAAPSVANDAVMALVALGYSQSEALRAVKGIEISDNHSVEDVLKEALKQLF